MSVLRLEGGIRLRRIVLLLPAMMPIATSPLVSMTTLLALIVLPLLAFMPPLPSAVVIMVDWGNNAPGTATVVPLLTVTTACAWASWLANNGADRARRETVE